jgi:hypothetical protein
MVDSLNSITLNIEDEGSFETLVLHGLIVDVVASTFRTPWVDIYEGYDLEEDMKIKLHRRKIIINACKEWETYLGTFSLWAESRNCNPQVMKL